MSQTAGPSLLSLTFPGSRAGLTLVLALAGLALLAPDSLAVTPRVHAIRNARVVTAPGQVMARASRYHLASRNTWRTTAMTPMSEPG